MSSEAITIRDLSVRYVVHEYRSSTLKEYVMNRLRGRSNSRVFTALEGINLQIQRGQSVAFLGHNGSGKSTLLKCIAGIIRPKGASVQVVGRVAPMIELGTGFDGELSGLENIRLNCTLLGLSEDEIESRMEGIIRFAELKDFIDMPLKNYSSGMQARLGFACSTAVDPDVLLVDEVLSVGDSNFSAKCLHRIAALRDKGTTVVLVSHDPSTIERFCDRAVVLDEGKLVFDGSVSGAFEKQKDVMHSRMLRALPDDERAEYLRKEKLAADALTLADKNRKTPRVHVTHRLIQNDEDVKVVDITQPFQLQYSFLVKSAELFSEGVTVGFGLHTEDGIRLGGCSSQDFGLKIDTKALQSSTRVDATFHFPKGLPLLCAGTYRLIVGLHQQHLTQTICAEDLGPITFVEGNGPGNFDKNIYSFKNVTEGCNIVISSQPGTSV